MQSSSTKLWFKRRRYGWGWTPVTWQGLLTVLLFLLIVLADIMWISLADPVQPTTTQILLFLTIIIGAALMLIGVCIMKGPTPHFRWGKKPTDNPDEDY